MDILEVPTTLEKDVTEGTEHSSISRLLMLGEMVSTYGFCLSTCDLFNPLAFMLQRVLKHVHGCCWQRLHLLLAARQR